MSFCGKCLGDVLLTMCDTYLNSEFTVDMLCKVLCGINAAVTPSGTSEREHEVGESAVDEALDMEVGKSVNTFKELENLSVLLKEVDYRLVKSCQRLVLVISSGVVGASAVEHIPASVA